MNSTTPVRQRVLVALCLAFIATTVIGQSLIYDHLTGDPYPTSSNPYGFTAAGGSVVFAANHNSSGTELWKTDGTPGGTSMLYDIGSGVADSEPRDFISVNGITFFTANDVDAGRELWKTDGTKAGTVMVKDIAPETWSDPRDLAAWNGILYFSAFGISNGRELWRSDGTEAGTFEFANVDGSSSSSNPQFLTLVGDKLYFAAKNASAGTELWKTDGTTTSLVKDLCPLTCSGSPQSLTNVNGVLYFTADAGSGRTLWRSDGTALGTVPIANAGTNPQKLFAAGTKLLYAAGEANTGIELWVCDGLTASRLTDLSPGAADSSPSDFAIRNGVVYFSAASNIYGREIFTTNGLAGGTVLLSDISPGVTNSNPTDMYVWGNYVYFAAFNGAALWRTDGTSAGTVQVRFIGVSTDQSFRFSAVGSYLYFAAALANDGAEPFRTDGTSAGTIRLADIGRWAPSGGAWTLGTVGNRYAYLTWGPNGLQPWISNGLTSGTHEIGILRPGGITTNILSMKTVGSQLFFNADDGVHGDELWATNGDTLTMIKDINPAGSSYPSSFVDVGGTLYFSAFDGSQSGLYKTNGTGASTTLVKQICAYAGCGPMRLTNVNGTMFFITGNFSDPRVLWKSDGTAAGTMQVPGASYTTADGLAAYKGKIYFECDLAICRSDGTNAVAFGPRGYGLTVAGDNLYFQGYENATGFELWKFDGTTTSLVKDLALGSASSRPMYFTDFNGTLLFFANDNVHGVELWRSDGTDAGTRLVKDINPGRGSCGIYANQVISDGRFFFAAADGETGSEPWSSDGTEAGTARVADLEPGPIGSAPFDFAVAAGRVFFAPVVYPTGRELWALCGSTAVNFSVTAPATAPAGVINVTISAVTAGNSLVSCYGGTVHFSSTDPKAILPPDSAFGNDSGGAQTFPITLGTVGIQTITVTDVANPSLTRTFAISIDPGPASPITTTLEAAQARVQVGNNAAIYIRPRDQFGNIVFDGPQTIVLTTTAGTIGTVNKFGDANGRRVGVMQSPPSAITAKVTGTINGAPISSFVTVQFYTARSDVGGDRKGDVLWRHANGSNFLWQMNGEEITPTSLPPVPDTNWKMTAIDDFNGDGNADIFWRHTNGTNFLWLMNGGTITPLPVTDIAAGAYDVAGSGDVNGDGRADIFWRNASNGGNLLWLMNGATPTQMWVPPVPAPWVVVGLGDTDGDGRAEVVWRHPNGLVYLWSFDQTGAWTGGGALAQVADTEWRIVAIADVTGDGTADFLWRRTTGEVFLWEMHGFAFNPVSVAMVADTNWKIVVVTDVDGDGKADVVWRHTTGPTFLWLMNSHGNLFLPRSLPPIWDTDWTMIGPR